MPSVASRLQDETMLKFTGGGRQRHNNQRKQAIQQPSDDTEDQMCQSMTVLGMQHKHLHCDREDPATMSMYSRKIGLRDFGQWLRKQNKIKPSNQIHDILRYQL
jgi:hypothetical protein